MLALSLLLIAQQLHYIRQLCLKCAANEEKNRVMACMKTNFCISSKLEHMSQENNRVFGKTENCVTFIGMNNGKYKTKTTNRELVFGASSTLQQLPTTADEALYETVIKHRAPSKTVSVKSSP